MSTQKERITAYRERLSKTHPLIPEDPRDATIRDLQAQLADRGERLRKAERKAEAYRSEVDRCFINPKPTWPGAGDRHIAAVATTIIELIEETGGEGPEFEEYTKPWVRESTGTEGHEHASCAERTAKD